MSKPHTTGTPLRRVTREERANALQSEIDRAVTLADREIGIGQFAAGDPAATRPLAAFNRPSATSAAPTHPVPAMPPPEPISVTEFTERIRAGWVPVMGLPGTPISSGFIRDMGEYNPKLEGINGIWTYE